MGLRRRRVDRRDRHLRRRDAAHGRLQVPVRARRGRYEYIGEFYNDKATLGEGDDVAVTAGATTAGIDAVLARASQVTGTVTLPSGDPAAGVRVTAYREDAEEGWLGWSDVTTDAAGAYVIKGLAAGDYKVGFKPPTAEYAFEYYDDEATLSGG